MTVELLQKIWFQQKTNEVKIYKISNMFPLLLHILLGNYVSIYWKKFKGVKILTYRNLLDIRVRLSTFPFSNKGNVKVNLQKIEGEIRKEKI